MPTHTRATAELGEAGEAVANRKMVIRFEQEAQIQLDEPERELLAKLFGVAYAAGRRNTAGWSG
jgi:hypothetical protein